MRILVTGAGGFIGSHLVRRLKYEGHWVRGADLKQPEFDKTVADEFHVTDLRSTDNCLQVCGGVEQVYNLAADMGGIGYITAYLANIARNNTLINVNMLDAAVNCKVQRFLFSSSACVYNQEKQLDVNVTPLKEEDAYPALPERGYGWEKLYAEQLCEYYSQDYGLDTRIVRFHNVYGPFGTYDGGKEKSPAALCRKIALAEDGSTIDIWGDGKQTRSYMYIDDCVKGLLKLMESNYTKPLNLGTDEIVSVDELASMICKIAGKKLKFNHQLDKPQGVRGRNSDNTKLLQILQWEPQIKLMDGLRQTYKWINQQTHPPVVESLKRASLLKQLKVV